MHTLHLAQDVLNALTSNPPLRPYHRDFLLHFVFPACCGTRTGVWHASLSPRALAMAQTALTPSCSRDGSSVVVVAIQLDPNPIASRAEVMSPTDTFIDGSIYRIIIQSRSNEYEPKKSTKNNIKSWWLVVGGLRFFYGKKQICSSSGRSIISYFNRRRTNMEKTINKNTKKFGGWWLAVRVLFVFSEKKTRSSHFNRGRTNMKKKKLAVAFALVFSSKKQTRFSSGGPIVPYFN